MAPRNSLVSHSSMPALYFSEPPYTPKYRARVLGGDALAARNDLQLLALPKCKSEPKVEDFSEPEVGVVARKTSAVKQGFYGKCRTTNDQEEGKDAKPEITDHVASPLDDGGNPGSEPVSGPGPADCTCLSLMFSLEGLCEHRQRFNPIYFGGVDGETNNLARPGICPVCLQNNHAAILRPALDNAATIARALVSILPSGLASNARSTEDHSTSNSHAPSLDLSCFKVPVQRNSYAGSSATRSLFMGSSIRLEIQAAGSGAPNVILRGRALQMFFEVVAPSLSRGALRALMQSPYRRMFLARPPCPEMAHLLNGPASRPGGAVSPPLIAFRKETHLFQCHRAMGFFDNMPLRAARLNYGWSQGYHTHASDPYGPNPSSSQGGVYFTSNGYFENGFTHGANDSRDQHNEPQHDSVLEGETRFGERFRQLFLEADILGLRLSLYPKQFEHCPDRSIDQHSLPGPSQIPLLPPSQYGHVPPVFPTSYDRDLDHSDALPCDNSSYANFGHLGGLSNVLFSAPPFEYVTDCAVGPNGRTVPPTPSLLLHTQYTVAPSDVCSVSSPRPTAAGASSQHSNRVSVRSTTEPTASEGVGGMIPASTPAGPIRTSSANSGVNQLRNGPVRKSLNKMCPECDRTFSRPHELADHMSSHTKVKTHICPNCKKGLATRSNLSRHRKQGVCMR